MNMNTKSIQWISPVLFFFGSLCSAAEWNLQATNDPMTDKTVYTIWTFGSYLSCQTGSYGVKLAFRIDPTGYDARSMRMTFDPDVFIWSPAIKRRQRQARVDMTLRSDDTPPVTAVWVGSDNACALFCDNPKKTFAKLAKTKKLILRFSLEGREHTATFDLSELPQHIREVNTDFLKKIGKYKPPAEPICKKCKGKKEIVSWVKCSSCNGSGMQGNGRCKQCVNSIKLGHLKEKTPCPECSPNKSGSGVSYAAHGQSRAMRNHVRNQVYAAVEAQSDAIVYGYYDESKKWLQSKRLPLPQASPSAQKLSNADPTPRSFPDTVPGAVELQFKKCLRDYLRDPDSYRPHGAPRFSDHPKGRAYFQDFTATNGFGGPARQFAGLLYSTNNNETAWTFYDPTQVEDLLLETSHGKSLTGE